MVGALALLAVLLLAVPEAEACECPQRAPSDKAELALADTVFSGTVLSSTPSADGAERIHRFEVSRLYKGTIQRVTEVVSKGGKSCDFPFEPGKSYLVFSTGHGPLSATTCGRTRVLEPAKAKRPMLQSAPCALALEPALDRATKAATRFFKKDFAQYPSTHVRVHCMKDGSARVIYRSLRIPAEQLSMVRDAIEADVLLDGKTGKVQRVFVGP